METENKTVDWKEIGNQAFQEKKYEDAVSAYSNGLKLVPSDVSLLSNRALNYLNLGFFNLALADAESALKVDPKHVKALYRKVKALIGCRKYNEAGQFILKDNNKQILNSYAKDTKLGEILLNQIEAFLDQELNGNYNFSDILKEQTFEHTLADFNAPIALEEFKGRGRGLVTTQNVEAGQLLIGSKAFAFIVERKNRKLNPPVNGASPPVASYVQEDYSVERTKAKESLIQAIVQKIKKSPEDARVMYTLFAGSKLGHLELDESCNNADSERISKIVDCNALFADGRQAYEYKELMAGLWLFPSFINHSCYDGNVKWHMHGDFLAVIATKDIKAGEELRMSYVSVSEPLETREKLLSLYEVRCDCSLCNLQREESAEIGEELRSITKKYEDLQKEAGSMVSTETTQLEIIVNQMEGIHPGKHSHCLFLLEPYTFMAKRYFRAGNYEKTIDILERGRQLVIGTELTNALLTFTTNIISAHLKNKDKRKATEWVEILKRDVRICYGNPVDQVLGVIAPDLMKKLKLEKILITD